MDTFNLTITWIISSLWVAWLIYWAVAARNVTTARWREPRSESIRHRAPVFVAMVLMIGSPRMAPALRARVVPATHAASVLGLVILLAGLGLAVWARRHLGRNWSAHVTVKQGHTLIRTGPYRHVRHPIYSGLLLGLVGTAVAVGEVRVFVALALMLLAFVLKSRVEERRMRQTFADYDDYSQTTWAIVPFVY